MSEAKLKIAMVVGEFPQLSESFILRKAQALAEAGHRVTVLARKLNDLGPYGTLSSNLEVRQLPVDSSVDLRKLAGTAKEIVRGLRHPRDVRKLLRATRTLSPARTTFAFYRHVPFLGLSVDILHFEFLGLAAMYPLAEALLDVPWVVSCRGTDIHLLDQREPQVRAMLVSTIVAAPAVHCVSSRMAEAVAEIRGGQDDVWVNRPAIDTVAIQPAPPKRNGIPKIIAIGRLVWIKGYDYLLQALARVRSAGVPFAAEIVGDGPLRAALQYSVEELDLEDCVTLTGARSPSQVIDHLHASDVFVLSSHNEGISNAALEAMAAGLPVVTTDAGGMREAVRDGVDGLVVPIRDSEAMADALGRLLSEPSLREEMGQAARERAVSEFSLSRQVAGFERMYRSVIASHEAA